MSEQSSQVKMSKEEAVTSSEPNLGTTTIQGPTGMNFSKSDMKDNSVIDVPTTDEIDGVSNKIQGSSKNEEYLRIMRK